MKHTNSLKQLSNRDIVEVAKNWFADVDGAQLSTTKLSELIEKLHSRFEKEDNFKDIYQRLGQPEHDVFLFIAINGGAVEKSETVRKLFKNSGEKFTRAYDNLFKYGLVFVDKKYSKEVDAEMVCIPPVFLSYVRLPFHYDFFLGRFLWQLPTTALKKIGIDGLRLAGRPFTQKSLIYHIRKNLLDPPFLRQHMDNLQQNEKDIFRLLLRKGGVCIYRELLDVGYQRRYDHSKADFVNSLLSFSGLVFTAHKMENKYNNLLIIPRDIHNIIKKKFRKDTSDLLSLDIVTIHKKSEFPTLVLDNTFSFLRDIVIFASFINKNRVRQLSNGGVGKNDLKKVLPNLSPNKTVKYASFIALFCIRQQLIVGVGDNWKVSSSFREWLEDPQSCYRDVVEFWLNTNGWNEEFIEGNVIHAEVPPANLTNVTELRKLVLKNLETFSFGEWISFGMFYETLIPQIDVFIPKKSPSSTSGRFSRGLRLTLESIIAETLYWLGFVTLGLSTMKAIEFLGRRESSKLAAMRGSVQKADMKEADLEFCFKLNPLCKLFVEPSYLLQRGGESSETGTHRPPIGFETTNFIVQPNLEIITPPDLDLIRFYKILNFTEIKRVDVMTTLYISKESIRHGMDRGQRGEDMLEFLENSSKQNLPDTVRHLVDECTDKHGEVNVGYCGGYITVEDPILLEEMKSHKKIRACIKDVFDDKLVLLNPHVDVKKLSKELQRLGFMPHLDSEKIHLSSEGVYNLTLDTEELYNLVAALMAIESIEKDVGSNFSGDKVTSLLEKLNPESRKDYNITYYAQNISKNLFKAYRQASRKKITDITKKYKLQMSKLMTTSPSGASKFHFDGENPTGDRKEVKRLLQFAVEHEMDVDLAYRKANDKETTFTVRPESLETGGVFAYHTESDSFNLYRFRRIIKAHLL